MCPCQTTADHRADNNITVDTDGKIFMDIRNWDAEPDDLTEYEDLEVFMRYLDKYVRNNINGDIMKEWKRMNRNKTLIHRLKPGDIAYVTLTYEAKLDVWKRDVLGLAEEQPKIKPKYQREGKIARYCDAWSDEGRQYYKTLVKEYTRLWSDGNFITALVEHWRTYESKHHKKSYKRKRSSVCANIEEKDLSEEDTLMDEIPDFQFPALPSLSPSEEDGIASQEPV